MSGSGNMPGLDSCRIWVLADALVYLALRRGRIHQFAPNFIYSCPLACCMTVLSPRLWYLPWRDPVSEGALSSAGSTFPIRS